jgi:tetratricopeptide (TPR) repeat protein
LYVKAWLLAAGVVLALVGPAVADAPPDGVARGHALWQAGDLVGAEAAFRQAADADPAAVAPRMKLAGLLVGSQRYREGVEQFQDVLAIDPDNANAFVGMAIGYLHMGKAPLAAAALREALARDPANGAGVRALLDRVEARIATIAAHHRGRSPGEEAP